MVIWAATINCDIPFLKNLQKHPEYAEYTLWNSDKFLRFAFLGFPFEAFVGMPNLSEKHPLVQADVDKFKKLVESDCFNLSIRNHDCQGTFNMMATDFMREIAKNNRSLSCHSKLQEMYEFSFDRLVAKLEREARDKAIKQAICLWRGYWRSHRSLLLIYMV